MNTLMIENFEEILSSSFSLSSQAIYWSNKNGKIIYANDYALNGLGYTLEDIQKLYLWQIDVNINNKQKYINKLNEDYDSLSLKTYHKRSEGEVFPVEIVSKFTKISEKEYIISYAKDITNKLKKDEDVNFYFELINSSHDMIFLLEYDTKLVEFANHRVCETLGYSLEELKGMKISDFSDSFDKMNSIELPEVFKKIEKLNKITKFGIYKTKDGQKIPVETSVHLKNYHGKDYVTAISRDISDRLEVEHKKEELNNKLRDYNKTLQKDISKVKQELIEYENIMKRQSKMAAMGEMLENIAHQWRQPLSAVSVLSTGMILQNEQDLLNKELLDAGLNDINEQVQYLSKTIDDFRNFFKPNKQKNHFNLKDLINTSIKLSKARYSGENINFIVNVENIELYTYENELLQVLLNIISNAKDELVKKDYEKYIFVETYRHESLLEISIKDNGGGINELIINRIFEPYFTTKHKYQGTGIGLYMSENIIKHMSGLLSVKNEEINIKDLSYAGASFQIKLPY